MRILLLLLSGFFFFSACQQTENSTEIQEDKLLDKTYPYYDRYIEYNYPNETIDVEAYAKRVEKLNQLRLETQFRSPGFDKEWQTQGPGNIGARVNTLAINPNNQDEIYAGFSGGGLYKTEDGGENWQSIFDDNAFQSIGYVGIDPNDDDVIYLGTGDPNLTGFPNIGNGIFRSNDRGASWESLGLEEQRIISKIEVNPENSQQLFVASMGLPFEKNNTRGIYRSNDGGSSWEQVLFVSDSTGFSDVIVNPEQANIVYATTWDRVRSTTVSIVEGEGSNFYRSVDGGDSWTKIDDGLPDGILGRHGMDVCRTQPNHVYVVVVDTTRNLEGIYRSEDYGASFSEIPTDTLPPNILGGFGWYFGKVHVNPNDPDHIFVLGIDMYETRDAGLTWTEAVPPWWTYEVHADKHDLQIMSDGEMYLATDGGVYRKNIDEYTWSDIENIPTTQFYRTAYNPHTPDEYYGGAQDNGSTGGNAENINDWPRIWGGDGFQMVFHPDEPTLFFAETQRGNIVQFYYGYPSSATEGLEGPRNWDMQYMMSTHDPNIMYTGTNKIHISTDSYFPFWTAISDDLTYGETVITSQATITCLHESPIEFGVLIAGTNNGYVHIQGPDGSWLDVSDQLPKKYVTDVKYSPDIAGVAFASFSGFNDNDFSPILFRTDNYGFSWEPISGDLPDATINDIYIIPDTKDEVIFVGTNDGVYGTTNGGINWQRLGTNMPNIKVFDLEFNVANQELVAATFARSLQSYDIEEIISPATSTENEDKSSIAVYPNPSTGIINISGIESSSVQVVDQKGSVIAQLKSQNQLLDLAHLPKGWYWLNISDENGKQAVKKIVLQ